MAYKWEAPNIPSDTVLCPSAAVRISAPAAHVFEMYIRTESWPEWNSFMTSAIVTPPAGKSDGTLVPGTRITETVRMKPGGNLREVQVEVTEFETGSTPRVCWKSKSFGLRTLRTNTCVQTGGDAGVPACEFRTWEVMAGPLAYAVKALYGDVLQARFEDMATELKDYAEKTWAAEGGGLEDVGSSD